WREHRAGPANRRLNHLLEVKVIENLPLHVTVPIAQSCRGFIKSTMAEDSLAHDDTPQRTIEPTPPIQIRAVVNKMGNCQGTEQEEGGADKGNATDQFQGG